HPRYLARRARRRLLLRSAPRPRERPRRTERSARTHELDRRSGVELLPLRRARTQIRTDHPALVSSGGRGRGARRRIDHPVRVSAGAQAARRRARGSDGRRSSMNELFRRMLFLPREGSTFARELDHLHFAVILTTLVGATLVAAVAAYSIIRYHRR